MINKKILATIVILFVATIGLSTSGLGAVKASSAERVDCPGLITCPLTNQPVCLDRCPVDAIVIDTISEQSSCCLLDII